MYSPNNAPAADVSPVRLSYVAALRGIKPRAPRSPFTYAQVVSRDMQSFICLAASNPEGSFYGLMPDKEAALKAARYAELWQVSNVTFLAEDFANFSNALIALPLLNYLVCDQVGTSFAEAGKEAFYDLAAKKLAPNGLLSIRYRIAPAAGDVLNFLVGEFAPEMDVDQAKEFLQEIKDLGPLYFADHPLALASLERAIAQGLPDEFFSSVSTGEKPVSGTFNNMEALLTRGFTFVGDADVGANYMELVTPATAHDVLTACRDHLLYEPIKDFAIQRLERNDIWCRLPVEQSADAVELYGGFTYGITALREQVPAEITAHGKRIDLSMPPFDKLIDLMTTLPMGIGDFLNHPNGQGVNPADAVAAIHILVATGVARPMRSRYPGLVETQLSRPRWSVSFNRYLEAMSITSSRVLLASPIVGGVVSLSARDAFVIQAISRVGLDLSVSALLMELQRIVHDPALAAQVMDVVEPTPELARNIIQDVVGKSISRWYAYGLLAA